MRQSKTIETVYSMGTRQLRHFATGLPKLERNLRANASTQRKGQ